MLCKSRRRVRRAMGLSGRRQHAAAARDPSTRTESEMIAYGTAIQVDPVPRRSSPLNRVEMVVHFLREGEVRIVQPTAKTQNGKARSLDRVIPPGDRRRAAEPVCPRWERLCPCRLAGLLRPSRTRHDGQARRV